jgi:hypothetical protein
MGFDLKSSMVLSRLKQAVARRFGWPFGNDDRKADFVLFAIPLIAKSKCDNWGLALRLLNDTLRSVLNQSDGNFRILIAVNDDIRPNISDDPRIDVMILRESGGTKPQSSPDRQWMDSDRGYKHHLMTKAGERLGAKYIMFLDADDLVRDDLVATIRDRSPTAGCILRQGFVENMETGKVLQFPNAQVETVTGLAQHFDEFCGSSTILTYPAAPRLDWHLEIVGKGHQYVRDRLAELGAPAFDIMEPMAIYRLNTGINVTQHISNRSETSIRIMRVLNVVNAEGRNLTSSERRSFGLETVNNDWSC